MFGYLIRSVLQAIMVMVAVAFIAFSMFRYVGDPVASIVGQDATLKDREELAQSLGLNDPMIVQFGRFLGNAAKGDFGISYRQGRPVSTLLRERLPATIELAVISAALALTVGLGLGIYTALKRDGWAAHLVMSLSLIGVSLPTFLIGIGLIYFFGVVLRWLPTFGRGETVAFGWWTTGLLRDAGGDARRLYPLRPRKGPDGQHYQLPACPEEHHDPGRHHHRHAAGGHRRLRDHHRDSVQLARPWCIVREIRGSCRYPRHGGLSDVRRPDLRGREPRG
jgi:Binding-prot-dependent transport system membrane comp, N-term